MPCPDCSSVFKYGHSLEVKIFLVAYLTVDVYLSDSREYIKSFPWNAFGNCNSQTTLWHTLLLSRFNIFYLKRNCKFCSQGNNFKVDVIPSFFMLPFSFNVIPFSWQLRNRFIVLNMVADTFFYGFNTFLTDGNWESLNATSVFNMK